MEKHIAVDIGSSNGKVYLGGITKERKILYQEIARFDTPRVIYNNHLCINIYSIYEKLLDVLAGLSGQSDQIRSLGVDTWASDFGIVDASGAIKGLPVFYRDSRTKGMLEYAETIISHEKLYQLTTQRRLKESTLLQLAALIKEDEQALKEGDKLLFLGDLLMYMFTGNPVSELSVASYSQMFSMRKRDWEEQVFELFHIPKPITPRIVEAGAVLGRISPELCRYCGVSAFDIVAPAVHDTSSAAAVIPADRSKDWAFIATGTWFLVGMELDGPADDKKSCQYELSNTGLAFGKTMLKKNITAMWILQECRRAWNRNGNNLDFQNILDAASKAPPFCGMIETDDEEFFNPDNMPRQITQYLYRTQGVRIDQEDVGQIARIVYESIALKCAYAIEVLKKVTQKSFETVHMVGGASGIALLNQMIADAANVKIAAGVKEASSVGNLLLQAYGCNEVKGQEEISEIIRNTFEEINYYPQNTRMWCSRLKMYMDFTNCRLEEA